MEPRGSPMNFLAACFLNGSPAQIAPNILATKLRLYSSGQGEFSCATFLFLSDHRLVRVWFLKNIVDEFRGEFSYCKIFLPWHPAVIINVIHQIGLSYRCSGGFRGDEGDGAVVGLEFQAKDILFLMVFVLERRNSREISVSGWLGRVFLEK